MRLFSALAVVAGLAAAGCSPAPAAVSCDPACPAGSRCDDSGTCVPDPPGADMAVALDLAGCAAACRAPTPVCGKDGRCVACAADADCPAGQLCKTVGGQPACLPGCNDDARCAPLGASMRCCGMTCVDVATDLPNCGGCGMTCSGAHASATCAAGTCTLGACNAGWGDCNASAKDGCETNLHVDVANCGMCGVGCALPNAVSACADACYLAACTFGYDDCNGVAMDGCETAVLSDAKNCGACGNACAGAPHAKATCVNAACAVSACDPGFADCDGNGNNGCEAAIASDVKNCGSCGTVCANGLVCTNGACTCPNCNFANAKSKCVNNMCVLDTCLPGFADCDKNAANGCEVNLNTNAANCAACGTVCPNNAPFCDGGKCVVAPACGGWMSNGGCWYTTDVNQSCSQFCQGHGGFDAVATKHAGNPICTHFYPQKANGNNWVTVECCSTDNNTNWGADGSPPDPNFMHGACHLACACVH